MGNAGYLHHACAVAALVFLSGCTQSQPRTLTEFDVRAQIATQTADLRMQIERLKADQASLNKELQDVRVLALGVNDAHESLRKTFNHNVNLENEAKVRAMTARGACGTEQIHYPNGGIVYQNRQCTLKDLRP